MDDQPIAFGGHEWQSAISTSRPAARFTSTAAMHTSAAHSDRPGSGSVLVDGAGSAWILSSTGPVRSVHWRRRARFFDRAQRWCTVSVASVNGIYIGAQGIVTGNGTLDARVYNYGTVAPGTSIGTLTIINSPYRQAATGTLEIELASASSYDRLNLPGWRSIP